MSNITNKVLPEAETGDKKQTAEEKEQKNRRKREGRGDNGLPYSLCSWELVVGLWVHMHNTVEVTCNLYFSSYYIPDRELNASPG